MVTKRDPDAARARILTAAAKAFAEHGPVGARVDAIAAQAGVNKRMLYHYFGDKAALFTAVVNERLGRGPALPSDGELLVTGLAMDSVDLRLMVWAAIAGIEPAPAAGWGALTAELAAQQRAGQLRTDVSAQTLGLLVFAVSAMAGLLPDTVRMLGGGAQLSWAEVRRLMVPAQAGERTSPRSPRPRVRMLPEVRDR